MFQTRVCRSILILAFGASSLLGCEGDAAPSKKGETISKPSLDDFPAPAFQLTEDTEGTLFTWLDQDGSFQISEEISEIPESARETVRVVVDGESPGGPEHVYVADLRNPSPKKSFPLRALARSDWEALGKAAREKRIAALRPPPEPQGQSPAALGVDAIVYGADWCKPCHLAEDYLKKKGARVVKKDIEEDSGAAKEMHAKLKRAGLHGSSIPVLDVGGTILRGFSAKAIDAALARAH